MATFRTADVEIYYEVHGEGFPILLIAPGGMRSAVSFWADTPWNPITQLKGQYRVIAMDQRNAGGSTAPVRGSDSWHVYCEDQLALLDHLGVDKFHVAGMCIGGPYAFGLIQAAPQRVASATLFQSIGLDDNRAVFYEMFDNWAEQIKLVQPQVAEGEWQSFREAMYGGDFLFNVDREFVAACSVPLLVLCGKDVYHPESISREIAELAADASFIEHWKTPEYIPAAEAAVAEFLKQHTPSAE